MCSCPVWFLPEDHLPLLFAPLSQPAFSKILKYAIKKKLYLTAQTGNFLVSWCLPPMCWGSGLKTAQVQPSLWSPSLFKIIHCLSVFSKSQNKLRKSKISEYHWQIMLEFAFAGWRNIACLCGQRGKTFHQNVIIKLDSYYNFFFIQSSYFNHLCKLVRSYLVVNILFPHWLFSRLTQDLKTCLCWSEIFRHHQQPQRFAPTPGLYIITITFFSLMQNKFRVRLCLCVLHMQI